jgi:3-oxoacyl-[acyl-carrier protein] reductase
VKGGGVEEVWRGCGGLEPLFLLPSTCRNYAFTKAALMGYVAALAPHAARRGVAVNCIAPGFIETDMTSVMPLPMRVLGRWCGLFRQGGCSWDVAAAVAALTLPGAEGVTGQTLRVCGGNIVGR